MKDTNSNPICYSRQLHGTYRLVNEKDEEKYNMTFYNGCPADIPWRGGNIDDIEIKKVSGSALVVLVVWPQYSAKHKGKYKGKIMM